MNKSELTQQLSARLKGATDLAPLLDEYELLIGSFISSDPAYRNALRPLLEELPDLRRLVTRKYDAVLKGRLQDALGVLKRKIAETEPEDGDSPAAIEEQPAVEGRVRNLPNLGMD